MTDERRPHEIATLRGVGERESEHRQSSAPREISPQQWARFGANMREIFEALGMEMDTPGRICEMRPGKS
jgi:hypothetical protein